jgi:BTB/POZ domain
MRNKDIVRENRPKMKSSVAMDIFYEHLKKDKFTDIILVCEEKKIKCHKIILTSR